MGPSHSCSYCDIAVDMIIDQHVCSSCRNKFLKYIAIWTRFRDDVWVPWVGSELVLIEFDKWLNGLDPALKFVMKYDIEAGGIEFLELFIYTHNDNIETKTHSKVSDPHAYLLPSSCHPYHICENIPVGVFKRLKRCCSTPADYENAVIEYTSYLQNRDYSDDVIDKAIDKVKSVDRMSLINTTGKSAKTKRLFPLVMKFNPKLPKMAPILHRHKHILSLTPETSRLFPPESVMVTFKNERNLTSLLTRNKFTTDTGRIQNPPSNLGMCKSCGSCTLCNDFLMEGSIVKSPHTCETYKIKTLLTCTTPAVIYALYDIVCNKMYIGYTKNPMKVRWQNHKSHIKKQYKNCEVAKHFKEHQDDKHKLDKSTISNYTKSLKHQIKVMIIESVDSININDQNLIKKLEAREAYFQSYFKTTILFGGLCRNETRKKIRNSQSI